jgi:YbbR domain-containing protein
VHIPVTPLSSLKTLPVLVPLQGHVKSGYRLVSIVTTPQAVTAKGAPSSLSAITQVWTAPVSLSGRQRTFTARVGLQLARGVTANSSSVQVTVAIQALHH